jgi:hypothetical protein
MSHECPCGKWYATPEGVSMCQANRHGNGNDRYEHKYYFSHTLEIHINHTCAECGEKLTARRKEISCGDVEFEVLPHICAVDYPEGLEC